MKLNKKNIYFISDTITDFDFAMTEICIYISGKTSSVLRIFELFPIKGYTNKYESAASGLDMKQIFIYSVKVCSY